MGQKKDYEEASAAAYDELDARNQARETKRARAEQRAVILRAIDAARHYAEPEHTNYAAFARRWAPHWIALAELLREELGLQSLTAMEMPNEPSCRIARALFESLLAGERSESFTEQLVRHTVRLAEFPAVHQYESAWGLRLFLDHLRDHVTRLLSIQAKSEMNEMIEGAATPTSVPAGDDAQDEPGFSLKDADAEYERAAAQADDFQASKAKAVDVLRNLAVAKLAGLHADMARRFAVRAQSAARILRDELHLTSEMLAAHVRVPAQLVVTVPETAGAEQARELHARRLVGRGIADIRRGFLDLLADPTSQDVLDRVIALWTDTFELFERRRGPGVIGHAFRLLGDEVARWDGSAPASRAAPPPTATAPVPMTQAVSAARPGISMVAELDRTRRGPRVRLRGIDLAGEPSVVEIVGPTAAVLFERVLRKPNCDLEWNDLLASILSEEKRSITSPATLYRTAVRIRDRLPLHLKGYWCHDGTGVRWCCPQEIAWSGSWDPDDHGTRLVS